MVRLKGASHPNLCAGLVWTPEGHGLRRTDPVWMCKGIETLCCAGKAGGNLSSRQGKVHQVFPSLNTPEKNLALRLQGGSGGI